jgi:hypothetical protein
VYPFLCLFRLTNKQAPFLVYETLGKPLSSFLLFCLKQDDIRNS